MSQQHTLMYINVYLKGFFIFMYFNILAIKTVHLSELSKF